MTDFLALLLHYNLVTSPSEIHRIARNKKSREVIREIFYNSMEASVLFVRLESRYGDSVIHL